MHKVVIVAAKRTPIGSFLGQLSSIPAVELGAIAIKAALKQITLNPEEVDEVFMGHVVQAGCKQAPARQSALLAGLPENTPCTTVNKVCASGLKSVQWAAQSIALGDNEICVAGGMENMSLIPHYSYLRKGQKFGSQAFVDGLQEDGLNDAYDAHAMGVCADECATKYGLSREAQDEFAISSYEKAAEAWKNGAFKDEIAPVSVPQRRGEPLIVDHDEEYQNVRFDKIPHLRAAFSKDGTVAAANASTINDGAAAVVLMSEEKAKELGLSVLAYINSYADAATAPKWFTIAPSKAIPSVLEKASLNILDVDYFEVNEAFSAVALANQKILSIPSEKLNTRGGAVALGHPLGCSGTRILVTLIYTLIQNQGTYGVAGICNGGGGASAMLIERK